VAEILYINVASSWSSVPDWCNYRKSV